MSKSEGGHNPSKKAVALQYGPGDPAPVVVASGMGYLAEKMVEVAANSGVPVYEDNSLATVLSQLELGRPIPEELYQAIVEIYVYFLRFDPKTGKMREDVPIPVPVLPPSVESGTIPVPAATRAAQAAAKAEAQARAEAEARGEVIPQGPANPPQGQEATARGGSDAGREQPPAAGAGESAGGKDEQGKGEAR